MEGFLRHDLNVNRGRPDLAMAHDNTANPDTPVAKAAAQLLSQSLELVFGPYLRFNNWDISTSLWTGRQQLTRLRCQRMSLRVASMHQCPQGLSARRLRHDRSTSFCHQQAFPQLHHRHQWQSNCRRNLAGLVQRVQFLEIQHRHAFRAAASDSAILPGLQPSCIICSRSKLHSAFAKQGSAMALGLPFLQWVFIECAASRMGRSCPAME